MKDVIASFTPSNLTPVWITDQFDAVTSLLNMTDWGKKSSKGYILYVSYMNLPSQNLLLGNETKAYYGDLWDGTQASSCLLPCTTWSTDTRLLGAYTSSDKNSSQINLTFAPKVTIRPLGITLNEFDISGACNNNELSEVPPQQPLFRSWWIPWLVAWNWDTSGSVYKLCKWPFTLQDSCCYVSCLWDYFIYDNIVDTKFKYHHDNLLFGICNTYPRFSRLCVNVCVQPSPKS